MLFNSYAFLFGYLPVTFSGFFLLARYNHRLAASFLAAASIVFYGYWNPAYVGLLAASIVFNFVAGVSISPGRQGPENRKKRVLTLAIIANLTLLAYYKYANFFVDNVIVLGWTDLRFEQIVLPLGISFFTFTQIAFLVDAYKGLAREYSFTHYVLFVTYFPHLIAGPVLHHSQMMPQFDHPRTYRIQLDTLAVGATVFIIGLAKKVLIADTVALGASPMFKVASSGGEPSLIEAWSGVICYSMQIYFDFSGYSDMAIGLSLLFGIALPLNFASPYKATSIVDFWRRWHMTLSQFLRDYLYVPLGGNRRGSARRYLNVFLTMVLGGLWHGAGWTFIVWGAMHGAFIVINQLWRATVPWRMPRTAGWMITFAAVVFAWVAFRSPDISTALRIYCGMVGLNGISLPASAALLFAHIPAVDQYIGVRFDGLGATNLWITVLALPTALIMALTLPNTQTWVSTPSKACASRQWAWKPSGWMAGLMGLLLAMSILKLNDVSEFIYFQF